MLKLLKKSIFYETIFSYLLGLGMLPYALTKLFRTQFIVFPFHQWSEPLKDISGITLTWAFLGYSKWFTILLGVLEFLPAILLLFRKTRLLGAIIILPVILNVFLTNIALELWQGTQIVSGFFLILNLLILVLNISVLKNFVINILSIGSIKKLKIEIGINIVLIGIVSSLFFGELIDYIGERNFLTGDWYNARPNYWLVKETSEANMKINQDRKYEEDYIRYYFHPDDYITEFLPASADYQNKRYKVDEEKKILKIFTQQKSDTLKGKYILVNDTVMIWSLENGKDLTLLKKTLDKN